LSRSYRQCGRLAIADTIHPQQRLCATFETNNKTKVGWTAGRGMDWMFLNRWSVGAEYLYVDLGKTTVSVFPIGGSAFQNVSTSTFDNTEHVVRKKLNYHFGG
jgi:opacity protein-like surface antigen